MKRLILAMIAGVFLVSAAMAASPCGDSQRVAFLLHEASYADDRIDAESRLISRIFPVAACLSREGYLVTPSGIPGRFAIVLDILGALRRQSVRMSTPEDVDSQLRLWKMNLPAQ